MSAYTPLNYLPAYTPDPRYGCVPPYFLGVNRHRLTAMADALDSRAALVSKQFKSAEDEELVCSGGHICRMYDLMLCIAVLTNEASYCYRNHIRDVANFSKKLTV